MEEGGSGFGGSQEPPLIIHHRCSSQRGWDLLRRCSKHIPNADWRLHRESWFAVAAQLKVKEGASYLPLFSPNQQEAAFSLEGQLESLHFCAVVKKNGCDTSCKASVCRSTAERFLGFRIKSLHCFCDDNPIIWLFIFEWLNEYYQLCVYNIAVFTHS